MVGRLHTMYEHACLNNSNLATFEYRKVNLQPAIPGLNEPCLSTKFCELLCLFLLGRMICREQLPGATS